MGRRLSLPLPLSFPLGVVAVVLGCASEPAPVSVAPTASSAPPPPSAPPSRTSPAPAPDPLAALVHSPQDEAVQCDRGVCTFTVMTDRARAKLEATPDREHLQARPSDQATQEQFATVARVPWLTAVDIEHCDGVTDLTPLASMPALRYVVVDGARNLKSLEGLRGTHVRILTLRQWDAGEPSAASALSVLSSLAELEDLTLFEAPAVDLSTLRGLRALHKVALQRTFFTGTFAGTAVEELWLQENQLTSLSLLAGAASLRRLTVVMNDVRDASALRAWDHPLAVSTDSDALRKQIAAIHKKNPKVTLVPFD